MDFLKSAVASAIAKGSSFPYSFGDRVDDNDSIWTLHNGTKREDGSSCSIFTFDIAANKPRLPLAKNAVRKHRTLRHPGVVKVLETIETDMNIYIVTERITPLSWPVKRRSLSEETAKWGLFAIASTLKFINEDASSVHGAVRVSSIYTSESGEWKLGGFDILSSMKEDDAVIYTYGSLMPDSSRYAPPEITKGGGWETIKRNPLPATDSYNFGCLIFEVFNGSYRGNDQAGQTSNVPPSMHQSYKRLMNPNPKLRLSVAHFLEQGKRSGGFFETPLIRLTQDIESLGLKSEGERDQFINELDELTDDFPEDFFKMKVLPELLKSVEFGGGGPKVFASILKIGTKLSEEEYSSKLIPVIVRLFGNPDRAMRVCLLDNLPLMIDHLPQKIVNDKIFPQMVTGFTDIAPVVREQTVKAVLAVIGKLSDRTINGELLRYLAKTANDEQPGIRTNTTICLGRIARNLGQSSRAKVLTAAFSRSLRDPFVHARNAGLLALSATLDLFTEEDCATKLLPAICPSLLDKEKLVRDQANKTLDLYLQRIRKFSASMPDTTLPAQNLSETHVAVAARMGTPNDTSWAGWAISSFTNKITSAKGEIEPTSNGSQSAVAPATRASSMPHTVRSSPSAQVNKSSEALRLGAPQISRTTSEPPPKDSKLEPEHEEEDAFDAWGAIDDEDNEDDGSDAFYDAKGSPSPSLPTTSTHTPFDDGGEPDFAGWLAAQSKAKSKRPLPKGLSKSTNTKVAGATRLTSTSKASVPSSKSSSVKGRTSSQPAKTIDTKPKEDAGEDDWGDAWD
ncbi:SCY1 protein kinase [Blastomyces gilchristii SLH14081]|uniref:SCY1 protein kinase n=1 Tax=Blastomyces gilchristii (strain SLH14081) TaxID=559298 RepID=A0A179UDI1_BLAGS|nr:SCY1 protein kinase [Blastomyces gilchristii SLH14081]OAT06075.1 SCY1 protein kinase [Blastomyces gilchristii SLH14081]